MAVKFESSIKRLLGLSTDTKPKVGVQFDGVEITAKDLPVGSSFLEEDTGHIWRWNGLEWTHPKDVVSTDLEIVLAEVRDVKQLLESFIAAATS